MVAQLARRMRAASPHGSLTPSQRTALSRLERDGPATTAALARAELVRPQSMRTIVAALEEQGLVARSPHPTDGRQIVFTVTPEGHRGIAAARRAKQDWLLEAVTERLSANELRTLTEATELLRRLGRE
ncbi:MarR family transcriptional regulator [Streptomyces albus subsp. albus]|nr:MarR family transcriptional regulator [Streptomyces albus subsp. albus]